MNIVKFELKNYLLSFTIWVIGLMAVSVGFMSFFPMFNSDMKAVIDLLSQYPKEILQLIGINEPASLVSVFGYYGVIILYSTFAGGIFALQLGLSLVSKEKRNKTTDFLFSRPISRLSIFVAKISTGLFYLLVLNIVLAITMYFVCNAYSPFPVEFVKIFTVHLGLFFIQLLLYSIGILFAVTFKKVRSCAAIAIGFLGMNFVIGYLAEVIAKDWVRYFTVFKYFPVSETIASGHLHWPALIICVLGFILCITTSGYLYLTKDLHAV